MFGNNKDNKPKGGDVFPGSINIIGAGTQINGDVISAGDIRIDGNVTGKIVSKAKVVIGPQSIITGDIQAQNADISGKISGKIEVSETLFLKSTAVLKGDISVNKLVVESGAEFNGNSSMHNGDRRSTTETKATQNAKQQPEPKREEAVS